MQENESIINHKINLTMCKINDYHIPPPKISFSPKIILTPRSKFHVQQPKNVFSSLASLSPQPQTPGMFAKLKNKLSRKKVDSPKIPETPHSPPAKTVKNQKIGKEKKVDGKEEESGLLVKWGKQILNKITNLGSSLWKFIKALINLSQ